MTRSIFTGKSRNILVVLLSNPSEGWTTRKLASVAGVSIGQVSIVTNKLIDMGFLVRERSMRLRLRKEEELLRRWASSYDPYEWPHKAYYARGTLYELGKRLANTAVKQVLRYAFTGPFAADLLTQYIRAAEIHVLVTDEITLMKFVDALNLEIAEMGGNVVFIITDDSFLFCGLRRITDSRVGTVWAVSNTQLILDLFNLTDRTREAAERLIASEFRRGYVEQDIIELAKRYFQEEGLIVEEQHAIGHESGFDLKLFDSKTQQYTLVECKSSVAELDAVYQLKNAISSFGKKAKGVLVAPSITKAAAKELERVGLEFKPVDVITHGSLHKETD